MAPTSRLYDALNDFLRQSDLVWQDIHHLQTLCWMIIGMIESQTLHLNGFGVDVTSRAQIAQSHQRRFRRWLSNRRIDVVSAHHALIRQALSDHAPNVCSIPTAVLPGGIIFRFEVQQVQSRSLQTAGQIRPVSVVWGDCLDDAIPDFARGERGGIRQAASSGRSLEPRYELSENGLELDSP